MRVPVTAPTAPRRAGHRLAVAAAAGLLMLLSAGSVRAGLFDDEEARRAVLELRARINTNDDAAKARHAELAQANAQLLEQLQQLRRGLLDLNTQLEAQKADNASLRGANEQLQRDLQQTRKDQQQMARDLAELQRSLRDSLQAQDERFKRLEPVHVVVDGQEFNADPEEKRAYEASLAALRTGDFDKGAAALGKFVNRYPNSGYLDSARFWLANALYGQKNYTGAITVFRAMLASAPEHPRAPEALLGVANCQLETKDPKAARKSLEDLVRAYPSSEAATAAKDRLNTLKG